MLMHLACGELRGLDALGGEAPLFRRGGSWHRRPLALCAARVCAALER